MKCKWCHRVENDHNAKTMACPIGPRTKIGFLHYNLIDVFTPKEEIKKRKYIKK